MSQESSRRKFLKQGIAAGLGSAVIVIPGCSQKSEKASAGREKKITSLAGLTPSQLHERYKNELFNRFIPAMDQLSVDHENGGIMCDIDIRNRKVINTTKKTWFQGRGIWVYSFLYNNFEKKPEFLEIARKTADFILSLKPSGDEFWTDLFSREGKPLNGPGDIYGDLFVAEGLAELSKATGDREYLSTAKKIILHCLERYDREDYEYNIGYVPGRPPIKGPRVLGHWMIFLSLSSQILNYDPDPEFISLSERCTGSIFRHLHPESRVLLEVVNHDMSIPENQYGKFCVIGHAMETLSFVMAEAVRRNNRDLFISAGNLFRRHVEIAADKMYGGCFEVLYNTDEYAWSPSKSAWCQQEILIGTMLMAEHMADEWAIGCFSELDAYVQDKMSRPDLAFWTFGGDRKMLNPDTDLVEHYHMPRHLMRNMLALERIMERNGNISGLV